MPRSFLFNSWSPAVKFSRYRQEDNQCFLSGIKWMEFISLLDRAQSQKTKVQNSPGKKFLDL